MLHPTDQGSRVMAAVAEASYDAIVITGVDGVITAWNSGAERLYGYRTEETMGRGISVLVPEGHRGELATVFAQVRSGLSVTHHETVGRTRQGQIIEVSLSASAILDAAGVVVGVATVVRDLTELRRDHRARRTMELRWRSVIESAVDGIVVIDARGRIEALNPAAERLFGYAEAETIGCNVSMLMPQPYRDEHDGYLARYLREGEARIIGIGREVVGQRKDGSTFPLHLSVGEMSFEGERKFTGILHDLSARVRIEEQLRERTALARLGEMAAVIAHEVKNPLAGVRGAIQVIGSRLPPDSPDGRIVNDIVARIDSLSDLMKDMLLFARPPQPKTVPTDITPLIAITADLLSTDPSLTDVRVQVEGSAPPVSADAGLLKIVFLNLLVNGAHAMKGAGTINVSVATADGVCVVEFRDHGPGMPSQVREKAFTPFFTTKSRGTGLGLATAKRLIEAQKGSISIDCPAGGGTTVTILLPIHAEAHAAPV